MYARKPHGFVTLISVLIMGAVGVAIMSALILQGLGSSRTSFASQQSLQARGLADACGEIALGTIRSNTSYTGTTNLTIGSGTCTFTVTNTGGSTRNISAAGTVATIVRHISISVATVSPVTAASWQEVAN